MVAAPGRFIGRSGSNPAKSGCERPATVGVAWRYGRDWQNATRITELRRSGRPLSRRFLHRADRLPETEAGAKPQLGGGSPPIHHADVADEIELRDREARDPECERELEERLRDRVRDPAALATELLQDGRQRHLA